MTRASSRPWGQGEESHRVGQVASVESERLVIELDATTTGLVKAGLSGVVPVGTINSYVTVPAGPHRIVGVITAIQISEDRGAAATTPREELSRRVVQAVMVGRLEGGRFVSGITTYPSLFSPVSSATPAEISRIFAPPPCSAFVLGEAVVAPDQDVVLDADRFLARHSAVVGSTGAGKTCSVVAVIDGLLGLDVPNANIIIFDANGEYAAAFSPESERGQKANACVIGPETGAGSGLLVPHWFMDNEDHLALLRASEGAQAPLLQRAVADARLAGDADRGLVTHLRSVTRSIQDVRDLSNAPPRGKPQEPLRATLSMLAAGLEKLRDEALASGNEQSHALWDEVLGVASGWASLNLLQGDAAWNVPLNLDQRNQLEAMLDGISQLIRREFDQLGLGSAEVASDFDAPRYYSLEALNEVFLPDRIEREAAAEPRVRGYAVTMLMRLSRLLADSRYSFMTRVPAHEDALTRFLRLILGRDPTRGWTDDDRPPWADAYRARGFAGQNHSVTILDLSLIASDVLENVTALLGRLLLMFAQRVEPRGAFPMLLVLEEAHRYVPAQRTEQASRSSTAFERVAKEGRKFGVSLLVASQRPSELSRTVLSQCGTMIAHRVVNPDDQELIRHATPFASRDLLKQLSGLATQHAIVLGEATQVPAYVRVREVRNAPRGSDPAFVQTWREAPGPNEDLIETTARAWEQSTGQGADAAENGR